MFLRLSLSCTRGTSSFLSYTATRSANKFFNPVQSLPRPSTGFSRGFSLSTSNVLNSGAHSARSNGRRRALGGAAAVASLGLGLATFARPVLCDSPKPSSPALHPASTPDSATAQVDASSTDSRDNLPPLPPPPKSSLNMFELSFGAVCGICAGVFVKKGVKLLAFFLGGVFVLLQYFASINLININWSGAQSRYEKTFNKTDPATGTSKPPTIYAFWSWIVNFLAADFPPRATFIAGLLLGIRVG